MSAGWIKATDRLPDSPNSVLAWNGYGVHLANWMERDQCWLSDGEAATFRLAGIEDTWNNISHWMPMPSGPEEGAE